MNFFKQSFKRQGFIDEHYRRWKDRKDKSKSSRGRKILVKSGRLRRSIRITKKGRNYVEVGTNVPYAQIHNEGGTVRKEVRVREHTRRSAAGSTRTARKSRTRKKTTVKAHSRKMNLTQEQRQFIGKSKFFNKRIHKLITRHLRHIFND